MYLRSSIFTLIPLALSAALPQPSFAPSPGNYPATGDGDYAGGIFSIPLSDLGKYANTGQPGGSEAPKGNGQKTSGSGPFPAQMTTDASLAGHTIFAPKVPPTGNVSIPVIVWGNGACTLGAGTYQNLLVEIASCAYFEGAISCPVSSS
jgi:hypothetical protein